VTGLQAGSFRLFRVKDIQVFIHWSWFVVAVYDLQLRRGQYSSLGWNVAEYLSLFLIVLLHEFGHVLATRQVGGQADRIVLWPLGGVAYVTPPDRPGATLWAIAAGPLVNLVLLPLALIPALASQWTGWGAAFPDAHRFLWMLVYINAGLLIFNLLPIYPLDGGQILRSLLWFWLGRARSLAVAALVGFAGGLGLLGYAVVKDGSVMLMIIAAFILFNCWKTWVQARLLLRLESVPRRGGYACPTCQAAPPLGEFWLCSGCRTRFDPFQTGAICPQCQAHFETTACVRCGSSRPLREWSPAPPSTADSR
jgi:Zn-dependent protease